MSLLLSEQELPQDLTTDRETEILEECQEALGYRFQKPALLRAALTHASGADTRLASNERLEFLGDAVLGLVVGELLMERFPRAREGELSLMRSQLVNAEALAAWAR